MHKIDSSNAGPQGQWLAGNPVTGQLPTAATAAWFNAIQDELANYIESRGITLNKAESQQLKAAITDHIEKSVAQALGTGQQGNVELYQHPTSHPASMIEVDSARQFLSAQEKSQILAFVKEASKASSTNSEGFLTYLPDGETQPRYCKGQLLQYFEMLNDANLGYSSNDSGTQKIQMDMVEFTPKSSDSRLFVTLNLSLEYEGVSTQAANSSPTFIINALKQDARSGSPKNGLLFWNKERVNVSVEGDTVDSEEHRESLVISYSRRICIPAWEGVQSIGLQIKASGNIQSNRFYVSFADFFIEEFS